MTVERARELLPIIKAYSEGYIIQYKSDNNDTWVDIENPIFNDSKGKYRIKPISIYRPFENKEECLTEMRKHLPFGWIVSKDTGDCKNIIEVYTDVKSLTPIYDKSTIRIYSSDKLYKCDMGCAFSLYNFMDGSPFGIEKN